MAKPPFPVVAPNTGPVIDNVLDKVFGPVEPPNIDSVLDIDPPGTGSKYMDSDIATFVAMLHSDEDPIEKRFVQAKANVDFSTQDQILANLRAVTENRARQIQDAAVAHYGDRGDIEGGVRAVQRAQAALNVPEHMVAAVTIAKEALADTDDPIEQAKIRRELLQSQLAFVMEKAGVLDPDGSIKWTDGYTLNKEAIMSVLGTFLPLRNISDFSNIDAGSNPVSGWAAYKEKVMDFASNPSAPAEDMVNRFEGVLAQLAAETDNPFLLAERASAFIDPYLRDDVKWGLIFDGADLALIGAKPAMSAAQFASALARGRKPIKIMRDMGDAKSAGELAAAAAADPNVAKAAGVSQVDAVLSASPFPGGEFDPRIVAGIAPETQAALAKARAKALEPLNGLNVESRPDWQPAEKAAAQNKYMTQFAGKARKVAEDEEGFALEVDIEIPDPNGIKRSPLSRAVLAVDDAKAKLKELRNKPGGEDTEIETANIRAEIRHYENVLEQELEATKAARQELADEIAYQEGLPSGFATATPDLYARMRAFDEILANPRMSLDLDPKNPDMVPSVRRINVKYTRDDWGNLDSVEYTGSSRFLNSPSTNVHQQLSGVVSATRARDLNTSTILQALTSSLKKGYEGLLPGARQAVDDVLLAGDENQKVYTIGELLNGVSTKNGLRRLKTVGEVNAYYTARDLSQALWELKNREVRRNLEIDGFKSLKITDGHLYVDARNPLDGISGKTVLDYSSGKIVKNSRKTRKEAEARGAKYYRMKYPHSDGKGERVRYVLAREADLADIPENPLRYRVGHVPKVIDNTHFIGRLYTKGKLDGIDHVDEKVVAFFDNFTDRDIWLAQQRAAGKEVDAESVTNFVRRGNNKDELEQRMFGGLYEGERTDVPIQWNLTGKEGQRISAYEALEAYMGHVASRVPTHVFKASLITKFTNTAKAWGAKNLPPNRTVLEDPLDWQSRIMLDPKSKEYGYFKAFQNWLGDQMRVTDQESRIFENVTVGIAEWLAPTHRNTLFSKATDKLSRMSLNMSQKDVTGVMRAAAFHATLGWFNPVQLLVQSFGAATMFMMHPLKASKIMAQYGVLRATFLTKNMQAQLNTVKAMERAGAIFGSPEESLAMIKAYQRSGLWQNTISTADHAGALARGDGAFWAGVKLMANKGLVFYREGERFARTSAWLLAREEWAKGRKILDYSIKDIDEITALSQKYVFNLDRSNRAMWQKGMLSIPTQFMQILAKFTEHMWYNVNKMESGWTAGEKLKVGLGQLGMFGAAGVPLGGFVLNQMGAWLQGKEIGGLGIEDPEVMRAATDGAMGWLLDWGIGADVEFAGRVALPEGYSQLLADVAGLFGEDPKVMDVMLGAFGEVPNRTIRAVGRLSQTFGAVDWNNVDSNLLLEVATEGAIVTSFARNVRKATIMRDTQAIWVGKVVDFEGQKLQPLDPKSGPVTIFAQAWGLQPAAVEDFYKIQTYNKLTKQDMADTKKSILMLLQRVANTDYYSGDRGALRARGVFDRLLQGHSMAEKQKIIAGVREEMMKDDYALANELITAAESFYLNEQDPNEVGFGKQGSLLFNKFGK